MQKKAKERAEQAAAAKAQKTPADNKQVQQKQQAVPDKNNLNLYMFCNDRCWVEVTVDGDGAIEEIQIEAATEKAGREIKPYFQIL